MRRLFSTLVAVGLVAGMASGASAQTCVGTCGSLAADGVVTLPPTGSNYSYVTTVGGTHSGGIGNFGTGTATNGSYARSAVFAAAVGDVLSFYFNYVTSDGSGFADYAWSRLLRASDLTQTALLFTARTDPTAPIVPGANMPAPDATLTPSPVTIQTGTTWSPLGSYSGACYAAGCGHSGWVFSEYTIGAADNSVLEFGVTNYTDNIYDSGMAYAGARTTNTSGGGTEIDVGVAPEPVSMMLMGTGLLGLAGVHRRRSREEQGEVA